MKIFRTHNNLPIVVVGDLHFKWKILQENIKALDLEDIIIFQSGDFGVGFDLTTDRKIRKENKRLKIFNEFFEKRSIFLYVIRGNHDNPEFFDGCHNLSHIIFMQDYDVIQVGDKKILGIGGALSTDRKENPNFPDMYGKPHPARIPGRDWWPGSEMVKYDEKKLNNIKDIDVVITHGAPKFAYPLLAEERLEKWVEYDPELLNEAIEEREIQTKIYNKLIENNDIEYYIYGHYHRHNMTPIDNTMFWCLEKESFTELRV